MSQEIRIDLMEAEDLEYHLPNEIDRYGNKVPHRKYLTGTDREGSARLMSVIGIMPTVVHGFDDDDEPHTLVVMEWKATPMRQGLRFKSVTIEMSFSAFGSRGAAEGDARDMQKQGVPFNYWDPEVLKAVPTGNQWYNNTSRKVGGKSALELGFSAGFEPFISAGPKWRMEKDTERNVTDAVQVTGEPFVVGSGRNRPNAVRWVMLENESQRSGVPAYLRTAILLKRKTNDDGIFLGHVEIETHVSHWEDVKEKVYKMRGQVKQDEPVIFNPKCESTKGPSSKGNRIRLDKIDLASEFRLLSLKPASGGNQGPNETSDDDGIMIEVAPEI
ncbi:hypothetical protein FGRMN_5268 [Fusarium graminum]|nr:hypothetical protein FGRMN_5268 [Fusarium graminum]